MGAQLDIGKLAERSRLQRLIEERPDDIDGRLSLARFYIANGDPRRGATELASVTRLHLANGAAFDALNVCRAALSLDSENLELRLLLAQVFARFPDQAHARIAEPIDVVDLSPSQQLEEVDIVEAIEVPAGTAPREEITRPPLPAAAKAASLPDTLEVGRPAPAYDAGGVPPRSPAASWPGSAEPWSEDDLERTLRLDLRDGGEPWTERDTSPGGTPAVGSTFERRRPAHVRASSRGAAARVPLGPAVGQVDPAAIAGNAILGRISPESVAALLGAGQLYGYPDAGPIVIAGKPIASLIILLDGAARVHDGSPSPGAPAFSARGQIIGDFEVLAGLVPRATVTAAGPARTIEIPLEAIAPLRDRDPALRDVLGAALRERVLTDLFDRASVLSTVPNDARRELVTRFFTQDTDVAEVVVQRGQINRRLLVVLDGQLVVDGRGGSRHFGRMTLQPGDFFGYVATILGRPSQVSVVAPQRSTLLVLAEQDVYRLVAAHKGVARAARKEAVERGDAPFSVLSVSGLGGALVRVPT